MSRSFLISAGVHALVILWLLIGNVFRPDPPEMQVSSVSMISEAEFAAMTQPSSGHLSVSLRQIHWLRRLGWFWLLRH